MRRMWGWYRRLTRRWQVVIAAVLVVVAVSPFTGDGNREEQVSADGRIEDLLPLATTTTTNATVERTTTTVEPTPTTAVPTTTTSTTTSTTAPPTTTTTAAPPPPPPTTVAPTRAASPACHPSYEPCVPYASDVDCAGGSGNGPAYTGTVRVIGPDEYELDRDGDGVGCE